MQKRNLSDLKLILSGILFVNLPITFIIISTSCLLTSFTSLKFTESGIIGCAIAWVFWEFLSKAWIKWALKQKVEEDRILKIGVKSLVLWKSDSIKIKNIKAKIEEKSTTF